jgi:nicotinate-nucleotide--dimethylbenzimidazole phosphoribosyltransferase
VGDSPPPDTALIDEPILDDATVHRLLDAARGPDLDAAAAVDDRASRVLRPAGALARLDRLAAWLAAWQRTDRPAVRRPTALLAAADHGIAARGVSAYPSEVTAAMVGAIGAGVATSSVLGRHVGAAVHLLDVGVGRPTGDISVGDALDPVRFAEVFAEGRRKVADLDCDLLVLGEMGIGNTAAAAALAASLHGGDLEGWVGRGTGLDDEALKRKRALVGSARDRVAGEASAIELLRRVGGAELVALAGACLEARIRSVPVVLDGFVVTAAVSALWRVDPAALAHCVAGHRSPEPGHGRLLDLIGLEPILDLGMRLGEGSGGLLAVPIIAAAAASVVEVATFEEWGLR